MDSAVAAAADSAEAAKLTLSPVPNAAKKMKFHSDQPGFALFTAMTASDPELPAIK